MTLPDSIQVDRALTDSRTVARGFERNDQTWCDGHDELAGLLRVLYPVYRVTYTYTADDGRFPWSAPERERDAALVDGLWADNDAAIAAHADGTRSTETVDPRAIYDEDPIPTAVLSFHGDERRAADVLPAALAHERGSDRSAHDTFDLPEAVDDDTFDGVEGVERVYLPFWVAEFAGDARDDLCYVAVRPTGNDWPGGPIHSVSWLEQFVANRQSLLESGSEWLGTERGTTTPDEHGSPPSDERTADRSTAADASTGEDEVVQPEGADLLDASNLVDPGPERSLADVGGMADLKERLESKVLDPLAHPERYEEYGLSTVNGVLLHGPPGCGKTYITGALAGELGQAFVRVSPADLSSKYMGEPAQKVQELFAIARANQPCVLFIDEIDAVASDRDSGDANNSEQGMVNQLLTELEDLEGDDVVVVGATNLVDDVDGAIRRSGRFDERVEVPPPDAAARREMLRIHLAGRPTADLNLEPVVAATAGYAASDLELLVDEAAHRALDERADVSTDDLLAAVEDTETSIDDWIGRYDFLAAETDATGTVVQPEGVEHLEARSVVEQDVRRTFEDVGGMSDLKERLERTVLDPLRQPERFEKYGLDPTGGVLLYGPPGCGKTYLSRALAGELGHYFLSVSPAELTSKWMGEPAQRVADLFEIARANQPCLVFLDEIDAVAGNRTGASNSSQQGMVNQLLTELESLADEDVVVVGATNLVDDVDGAIRRSGRFDERVEVSPPDAEARREILGVHLADRPVADGVDWERVVAATEEYAASDLELLADEAAHRALRRDDAVTTDDLLAAADRVESSLDQWQADPRGGPRLD